MAQLIVRGIEDEVKDRLRTRAARHGRSMEAEARDILRDALKYDNEPRGDLGSQMAARFKKIGLKPGETIEEFRGTRLRNPFER